MRYLKELKEGDRVADIYLIKHRSNAVTKNGKSYWNVELQDKTGTLDAKVWDPNSAGIDEFDDKDYVEIIGDVSSYNGALQVSVKRARIAREGEYEPANYLPVSNKNIDEMYNKILDMIGKTTNTYLKQLLEAFFVKDEDFIKAFKFSSAAKTVHHAFVGGLVEHTLSVAESCEFFAGKYSRLNRDLLVTAAICHDIGKIHEITAFPENDYSDEGNLIGHIVMGSEMISDKIRNIDGFPVVLANELKHCVLAHHGELEFGSPKKPALMEAVALSFADNLDAKMETFDELLENSQEPKTWQGFNRLLESNVRGTIIEG
ncbi:MAG: HD domain-containing protein [Lachnospiraceae bacterium]|nr:HD domain-containing protein [Candidatus Colinaster scatohippi]